MSNITQFCPKCGRLVEYDPYYNQYFCTNNNCNARSEKVYVEDLNISKIKWYTPNIISSEEALKDVVPIPWSEEVLSGKKKVEIKK